jgi:hypothetical protein
MLLVPEKIAIDVPEARGRLDLNRGFTLGQGHAGSHVHHAR